MLKVSQKQAAVLHRQVIDANGPGTVLRDFETLLEFMGPDGLRSTGKYHFLPLDCLRELDERMSRPLRPRLQRPQQRSFPNLNGLYLLLRATRLGVPKGEGKKTGRLVLDPAMLDQWQALNPTERYFNLLEGWLRFGRKSVLGEGSSGWGSEMRWDARDTWMIVSAGRFSRCRGAADKGSVMRYWLSRPIKACTLALLELFGLTEVERGAPAEGEIWRVEAVRCTEFGEALLEPLFGPEFTVSSVDSDDPPDLGAWQPLWQPYFPDWRNNLKFPEPEYRDGVYYFKVSWGNIWRRIAIPATDDLEALAHWIIRGFKFDGDHLYDFRVREPHGGELRVQHPYVDDAEIHTDECSIGYLPLEDGQTMAFTYDYGANWKFDVKLEKVEPPGRRKVKARIVESRGKAPREYEYDDEY